MTLSRPRFNTSLIINLTRTKISAQNKHHCYLPLFREILSFKSVKTKATKSKVIMGNGGFTVPKLKLMVFLHWENETVQTRVSMLSLSFYSAKLLLPILIIPIGIVAYAFHTFVGQPLSKQLHIYVGRVVRKLINAHPGLKVKRSIYFSCVKPFFTADVLCSLSLLKFKTKGRTL